MTIERAPASEAILHDLGRMAVKKRVPYGTGAQLAGKYGVTRERVRQLAKRAGITIQSVHATNECRRCQRHTRAAGKVCGTCLAEPKRPRMLALECEGCGVKFERESAKVAANAQQARRRGREVQVFCTAACAGRHLAGRPAR